MQPRTADDFATLYNELEAWRVTETRKVRTSAMSPAEKQQALQVLLHKVSTTAVVCTLTRLLAVRSYHYETYCE